MLENGDVYVPDQAEWLDAFLREVRSFPHGANDDMVDAFVHSLWFLKRHIDRVAERPYPAPDQRPPARQCAAARRTHSRLSKGTSMCGLRPQTRAFLLRRIMVARWTE